MATELLIRLKGAPEEVLESLVEEGFFNTKSEAIRAGIIELGKEYNLIGSPTYFREKLEKKLASKKISMKEIEKALSELEG
ncbi:MAG TPA: hypothetical protein VFF13_05845 [archaeon]|nr:hypothetical protein [archaeon]